MTQSIVDAYLGQLSSDLRDLPEARRRELLAEIKGHIEGALAQISQPGEADLRNVLARLGDPAEIADEARERFGVTTTRSGGFELAAIIGLSMMVFIAFGIPILALLGWVVGVILLWWSRLWATRDKVIGTLLMPAMVLLYRAIPTGTRWSRFYPRGVAHLLAWPIALGVIVHLARRAYRARPA